MIIVFEPLNDAVELPAQATTHSVGFDVRACLEGRDIRVSGGTVERQKHVGPEGRLRIEPGERALIPLGFKARLPAGCEAQIRLRSSVALEKGIVIPNAPATIDPDYPGEWFVLVANIGCSATTLSNGERFAQIVFSRVEMPIWTVGRVDVSTNRGGGAGSTGQD